MRTVLMTKTEGMSYFCRLVAISSSVLPFLIKFNDMSIKFGLTPQRASLLNCDRTRTRLSNFMTPAGSSAMQRASARVLRECSGALKLVQVMRP